MLNYINHLHYNYYEWLCMDRSALLYPVSYNADRCLNIKKHAVHNIHKLAWTSMLLGPRETAQRVKLTI
jgi:hypothetical protein